MRFLLTALSLALVMCGCASEPDVEALVDEGCAHVLAGEWQEALGPLRTAAVHSDRARRILSFVAGSTPRQPTARDAELLDDQAYDHVGAASEFGEAWRDNAQLMCRGGDL